MHHFSRLTLAAALAAVPAVSAFGQVLYSENFDINPSANWTFNSSIAGDGAADNTGGEADFSFNYGSIGIPAAPGSATTLGLKLEANIPGTGVFSGISVSPTGFAATGDYELRFHAWQNFNGPFPVGGSGSTQAMIAGIGTGGSTAQFPGGTLHGAAFATTGDGNSASDYRVYTASGAPMANTTGVYNAGTGSTAQNQSDPYYAGFGNNAAPAAQLAMFPQQTGNTLVGSQGMEWHEWVILKSGDTVTWSIDGVPIGTVPVASITFGGGNIFLGHFDTNATASTDTNARSLLHTIVDNVVVTQIPEPSALALLALGALPILRRRRR